MGLGYYIDDLSPLSALLGGENFYGMPVFVLLCGGCEERERIGSLEGISSQLRY